MAPSKGPKQEKPERLKQSGALNPHPERITDELFLDSTLDFFDPRDLVQVKYEMLRSVDKEGRSVTEASKTFGFSRPAYYQAQSQFKEAGLTGLIRERPGPKSAHKLTAEIMEFVKEQVREGAPVRARKLALLIKEMFGKEVHPRSIERAVARRGKKTELPRLANPRTGIEPDEQTSLQYESLRSRILESSGIHGRPSPGLALFVRRGMLAWAEAWRECIPANAAVGKQMEATMFPYETRSEMAKILANMTLSNLKDA